MQTVTTTTYLFKTTGITHYRDSVDTPRDYVKSDDRILHIRFPS